MGTRNWNWNLDNFLYNLESRSCALKTTFLKVLVVHTKKRGRLGGDFGAVALQIGEAIPWSCIAIYNAVPGNL